MGKLKPGQVRHQITLDEASEINEDLEAYAKKRGLSVAQANRCILADWSDFLRGKSSPYGAAIGVVPTPTPAQTQQQGEPVETEEERERREAALEASRQFM